MGATRWATTCSAKPATSAGRTSRPAELPAGRQGRATGMDPPRAAGPALHHQSVLGPHPTQLGLFQLLIASRRSPGRAVVVDELRVSSRFCFFFLSFFEAGLISSAFFFLLKLSWGFV